VRAEHEDVLRFWFERGAAGVRIDSAALLTKDPELPDVTEGRPHPYIDRDELHDIYRSWRAIADSYGDRALIGEIWLPDTERFARYLRPDELHTAFNFTFLACPWDAPRMRASIEDTLAAHAPVGAPATWVLCNHDVTRTVTRYGREDSGFDFGRKAYGIPTDLGQGTRRARAAALLTLALPGSVYVYQGEELGLPEVEDIPADRVQDPMWFRSGGTVPGRDGCRVPLPWTADGVSYGFGGPEPWLPQPEGWGAYAVSRQEGDPDSMLTLYRAALELRRSEPGLGDGPMNWLDLGEDAAGNVIAFSRDGDFGCVLNTGETPVALPRHRELLLASGPLDGGLLPRDTAVWLRLAD
jgi:alpha-glucosidase